MTDKIENVILDSLSQEYDLIVDPSNSQHKKFYICIYRINENCFTPFLECLFMKEKSATDKFCFPQGRFDGDEEQETVKELQYKIYDCIAEHFDIILTDISLMGYFDFHSDICFFCQYHSYRPIGNGHWKILHEIIERKFSFDTALYELIGTFVSPLFKKSRRIQHPKVMYLCVKEEEEDTILKSKRKERTNHSFRSLYIPTISKENMGDSYFFTIEPIVAKDDPSREIDDAEYDKFIVFEDIAPFEKIEITKEMKNFSVLKKLKKHGKVSTISFIEKGTKFYNIKFPNQFTRVSL
jgi:hypothetical protein